LKNEQVDLYNLGQPQTLKQLVEEMKSLSK